MRDLPDKEEKCHNPYPGIEKVTSAATHPKTGGIAPTKAPGRAAKAVFLLRKV